jgi:hypothetical protein
VVLSVTQGERWSEGGRVFLEAVGVARDAGEDGKDEGDDEIDQRQSGTVRNAEQAKGKLRELWGFHKWTV